MFRIVALAILATAEASTSKHSLSAHLEVFSQMKELEPTVRMLREREGSTPNLTVVTVAFTQERADKEAERDADNAAMQAFVDEAIACYPIGENDDWAAGNATNAAQSTHEICREAERGLFDIDAGICNDFILWLEGRKNDQMDCSKPAETIEERDTWLNFVTDGKDKFVPEYGTFQTKQGNCAQSTLDLSNKQTECHGNQDSFESDMCSWRGIRVQRCTNRQSCYDGAYDAFIIKRDDSLADAVLRIQAVRGMDFILCILAVIEVNGTDDSHCQPIMDLPYSEFNCTIPDFPAYAGCPTTEVDVYPGHTDFVNDFYVVTGAHHAVKSPVDEANIVACS